MNDSKQATKTEREKGLELALTLMGASAEGLAHTTNTLLDNLTAERDELRAELSAIREVIDGMLSGPYMPTPDAIRLALWPSAHTINKFKRGES